MKASTPQTLHLLMAGRCAMTWGAETRGEVASGQIIDPLAALGGLPRTVKVTAAEACDLLCWSLESLWASAVFSACGAALSGGTIARCGGAPG